MALLHALPLALAILAVLAAAPVEVTTDVVDAGLTETGLRARAGEAFDRWRIAIGPSSTAGSVHVSLTAPDGRRHTRELALAGLTVEDRSRELAASVALLLEQPPDPPEPTRAEPRPTPPEPPPDPPAESPPPPRPAIRGWLAIGPRLEIGSGQRVEPGGDLMGGVWLARDHVQPLASVGLAGGVARGISLLHARFGAGMAVGAPLGAHGRIWLGGHVLAHALFVRAEERAVDTTWLSSTEVGGLLQYRGRRLFLGLRTGVDLTLPPVAIRGTRGVLRRAIPRWVVGLTIGVVFG